jgi:hypothetical protein
MLPALIGLTVFTSPAHSQGAVPTEPARRAFALTIRGKQNTFKVGDEIRLQISWKNTSDEPVSFAPVIPTAETSYKVYVEDEKGNSAPETKFGRRIRTGKDGPEHETVIVFETAPIRSSRVNQ